MLCKVWLGFVGAALWLKPDTSSTISSTTTLRRARIPLALALHPMRAGYNDGRNQGRVDSRSDQALQGRCRVVEAPGARLHWDLCVVLLWLVRRPSMRYVPPPDPSSTIKKWRPQAKTMKNQAFCQHFGAMADCMFG